MRPRSAARAFRGRGSSSAASGKSGLQYKYFTGLGTIACGSRQRRTPSLLLAARGRPPAGSCTRFTNPAEVLMRFTLQLGFARYPDYAVIARTSEEAGFSSIGMPDSFFFPPHTDSQYPYAATAISRGYIEAMPFIEPLVALSWMAAATKKIRFYPSVM